jgi:hypothetical protein
MSNEEHVEEILTVVHKKGLYNQVMNEVSSTMISKGKKLHDAVFEVFYKYVKSGKIEY